MASESSAVDSDETYDDLDLRELLQIRNMERGSIQDEAIEFLLSQKGRLPRVAADIGVSQNTLYDVVSGRRTSLKATTAEKILRYKALLGDQLSSCSLDRLTVDSN